MRRIISFNDKWSFSKEATDVPESMPDNWYLVNLPHTWNDIDGQDGGNDYYRGECYYAKTFRREREDRCYFLEFLGVNSEAWVYVNGKLTGRHEGGYSTFRIDMTEHLKDENLIVVKVSNAKSDTVYPQNADFTFYGGIYRCVNIIEVPESHIELMYYGSSGVKVDSELIGSDARVRVSVMVANQKEKDELNIECFDMAGNRIYDYKGRSHGCEAIVKEVHLWNGKCDPYLYGVSVSLCRNGEVLDMVTEHFGVRTFEIDPDKGFILNGKSYPLRGVSRHQDWKGIGNALLPYHHKRDMELIMEMGANSVRLAHYQHAKEFYELCDENGLVVWAEIPYISTHMPDGRENTINAMKELIIQNYNHPSIVVWGLSNEITMSGPSDDSLLENHRALNDLAHTLDPSRKTTLAVVSMCDIHDPYIQIPDTVAYNHYFGWYGGDVSMNGPWFDNFHKEFPRIPIGMSEYGCEALNWHAYPGKQGDYTEEYQSYYHEELIKQLFTRDYIWCTYVWNMFDFAADARNEGGENGMNHKGLVTFDRSYKKDAFYAYKAWLSDEPFVHICSKRFIDRTEDEVVIKVYSNQPEVELKVNNKTVSIKRAPDHFFEFTIKNEGYSNITAIAGDLYDYSVIHRVDKPNENYKYKECGPVLNWFDITHVDGHFSLEDKIGDIMDNPSGRKLIDDIFEKLRSSGNGVSEGMFKMLSGFTVLRFANMSSMLGITFTKEELLNLNRGLNGISKR